MDEIAKLNKNILYYVETCLSFFVSHTAWINISGLSECYPFHVCGCVILIRSTIKMLSCYANFVFCSMATLTLDLDFH